jgi:MoxR-like ATPase
MNPNTKYICKDRPETPHADAPKHPEPYDAADDLVQAVNLAIFLRRPLLLEGEAGCGKTRLASHVAYELGLPFYRWPIASTTKGKDGQYTYDAILRLHDVEVKRSGQATLRDPSDPTQYREFGALGKAFQAEECPAVLLIDEIDKADVDFPNDLLSVLDDPWEFKIPETGETIRANHKPIVIITSNKEKGNLPVPFLRRCIYFYVRFPSPERLKEIVKLHYQLKEGVSAPPEPLAQAAIDRFQKIRETGGLFKPPGTSELLDWLEALRSFAGNPLLPEALAPDLPLPYRDLLLKVRNDWQKYASPSAP